MEKSENGTNLRELSNDDQNEAKKKEEELKEKQGTVTSISCKCYWILAGADE